MVLCWNVARPSVASHTSLDHTPFDPSVKTTEMTQWITALVTTRIILPYPSLNHVDKTREPDIKHEHDEESVLGLWTGRRGVW